MSELDWTAFGTTHGALTSPEVSKGVTQAFTAPNGGANFVHGFNSIAAASGFAGYYYSGQSAFTPIATGKCGSISAAMRRHAAGTSYAPMIGFIAGTSVLTAKAYILGLSDSDPYLYVLRKGVPVGGLDPTAAGVLRMSDESFAANTLWHHLMLDVVVNPNGDVVLNTYYNDLEANDVTSPNWIRVPGMDAYIDDALGVLSGEAPLTSGFRAFFGHYNGGEAGKTSLFDHFIVARQINP